MRQSRLIVSPRIVSRHLGIVAPGAAAGGAAYTANAVNFDGTNDYLTRDAGLTGAADSKLFTFSCWAKSAANTLERRFIRASTTAGGGTQRFHITYGLDPNNFVQIAGYNAAGTVILNIKSTAGVIEVADGWVNVLISCDMADTAKRHIYIDDVSDLATVTTYTDDIIDFTFGDWGVGGQSEGSNKWNGDLADLMFWDGVYTDFSVEANRRLFINASLKPVDPDAASGAVATLGTPIIRLTNPTATWHTNAGDGGGFTENGALTDAATSPSD